MENSEQGVLPVLYSFRRCPYAIRARMAIKSAGIHILIQEVSLKNKPQAMLHASSKGTVPVLCVDNQVIDESLNIMFWALEQKDPNSWWQPFSLVQKEEMKIWIFKNDFEFKPWLDKYKYSSRFPEHAPDYYRQQCEDFLVLLENTLSSQSYLLGEHISLADVAIFPFIRQFSAVDHVWFDGSKYKAMRTWLHSLISMSLFESVMEKPS